MITSKQTIRVVVPMVSDYCRRLRINGWEFASPGMVDRGDGYCFLAKRFLPERTEQVFVEFQRHRLTAWRAW